MKPAVAKKPAPDSRRRRSRRPRRQPALSSRHPTAGGEEAGTRQPAEKKPAPDSRHSAAGGGEDCRPRRQPAQPAPSSRHGRKLAAKKICRHPTAGREEAGGEEDMPAPDSRRRRSRHPTAGTQQPAPTTAGGQGSRHPAASYDDSRRRRKPALETAGTRQPAAKKPAPDSRRRRSRHPTAGTQQPAAAKKRALDSPAKTAGTRQPAPTTASGQDSRHPEAAGDDDSRQR